ncbi:MULTISPECIES: hypothetical protein [unclassified Burkholderia]|uniref:hypothetical protein n=1 Tax=unclassified Burkholderia TaxID=2613784 RepID=UPI000F5B7B66|nr:MULTISPECIES: hypothetical protein [unclassified Burkholderia]RQS17493.1 hypothetical protein DIE05_37400 [Burkholderia sp. Bp8995]RQS37900.1 hypothetical protein DIE00_37275 [Burkholderia sp. Bp8989]
MQTIPMLLKAGLRTPMKTAGSVFLVQSADQGNNLTVRFLGHNAVIGEVDNVGTAFKAKPPHGFSGVELLAPVDTNVVIVIADGDVDLQLSSLGVQITNPPGNPVPVSLVSEPGAPIPVSAAPGAMHVTVDGTVNVSGATLTATNVGVNNTAANPVPVETAINQTVATVAPVPVAANVTGAVLLAADATRRGVRFYAPQSNAGPVAIVPVNADAYANGAIVLYPGDFWNETEAPGAAWYASTPAGTSATVNLQTVKA